MDQLSVENKTVLIIGAAGLLGNVFTDGLRKMGANLIAADVTFSKTDTPEYNTSEDFIRNLEKIYFDITNEESLEELLKKSTQIFGKIDVVVNCAYPKGSNYGMPLSNVGYDDFCANTNVHLGGYFLAMRVFCEYFSTQGAGNYINFSSIYGSSTPRFEVYEGTNITMPIEYSGIKAAIENLSRYFAKFYKSSGIRVNCISPGGVKDEQDTKFIKAYNAECSIKGMLDPIDLLGTLVFLISDASKFITGQNLIVDDGFTL